VKSDKKDKLIESSTLHHTVMLNSKHCVTQSRFTHITLVCTCMLSDVKMRDHYLGGMVGQNGQLKCPLGFLVALVFSFVNECLHFSAFIHRAEC